MNIIVNLIINDQVLPFTFNKETKQVSIPEEYQRSQAMFHWSTLTTEEQTKVNQSVDNVIGHIENNPDGPSAITLHLKAILENPFSNTYNDTFSQLDIIMHVKKYLFDNFLNHINEPVFQDMVKHMDDRFKILEKDIIDLVNERRAIKL